RRFVFFSSRRRHTRFSRDWSSDVCSSDLKRRLEEAVRRVEDRLDVQVVWLPFQLDPTLPPEGLPWEDYVRERFGSPERFREAQARVAEIGREVGIPFAFEKVRKAPNTLLAHRLIAIAAAADRQADMVERIDRKSTRLLQSRENLVCRLLLEKKKTH